MTLKFPLYSDSIKILIGVIFKSKPSCSHSGIRSIERTLYLTGMPFLWQRTVLESPIKVRLTENKPKLYRQPSVARSDHFSHVGFCVRI